MRRWDSEVDRYVQECGARGLRETTQLARARELERFGLWLKRRKPRPALDQVGSDEVIAYILARSRFRSKSLVCTVVSILRSMGDHLLKEGIWTKNPLRWMRGPKLDGRMKIPRRIGHEHMDRLWKAAEQVKPENRRSLYLAILAVVYATGLRRGEMERLNISDWNRDDGVLRIDGQKTGVERRVPVSAGVWKCMELYLPARHNVIEKLGRLDEQALFIGRSGRRLRGVEISRIAHCLAKHADVPMVSMHQFRHTCASDLLESGTSLPDVQKMLGHACVTSTLRYTQITDPERAAAMRMHPVNDFLRETTGREVA